MNRRDFARGLAAFGLAPIVPVPTLTKAATAPIAAATPEDALLFIKSWSAHYVRKAGACSPEQLARHFGLRPETAQNVTRHLIKTGVLATPNALGVSQAVNPLKSVPPPALDLDLPKPDLLTAEPSSDDKPAIVEGDIPAQIFSEDPPSQVNSGSQPIPAQQRSQAHSAPHQTAHLSAPD